MKGLGLPSFLVRQASRLAYCLRYRIRCILDHLQQQHGGPVGLTPLLLPVLYGSSGQAIALGECCLRKLLALSDCRHIDGFRDENGGRLCAPFRNCQCFMRALDKLSAKSHALPFLWL